MAQSGFLLAAVAPAVGRTVAATATAAAAKRTPPNYVNKLMVIENYIYKQVFT